MVSAYVSGRKGAEETERRAGGSGGVEHRARDKQVSDRMVGGVAEPRASQGWEMCPSCSSLSRRDAETMTQMAGLSQDSPSLSSIWHSIPEGDSVEVLESPRLGVNWWLHFSVRRSW